MEIGKISLQEVTQAVIALIMVSVTAGNVAFNNSLPDQWVNMVLLVVGFYFGRATGDSGSTGSRQGDGRGYGSVIIPGTTALLAFLAAPIITFFNQIIHRSQ